MSLEHEKSSMASLEASHATVIKFHVIPICMNMMQQARDQWKRSLAEQETLVCDKLLLGVMYKIYHFAGNRKGNRPRSQTP